MRLRRKPRSLRTPLTAAYHLLHVDRQADYGNPADQWERIAKAWSLVLRHPVTAKEAALMMATMKVLRATDRDDLDDLADGAAYMEIAWHTEHR